MRPGEWTSIIIPVQLYTQWRPWLNESWRLVSSDTGASVSLHLGSIYGTSSIPQILSDSPTIYLFHGNRRQLTRYRPGHLLQKVHSGHSDLGGGLRGSLTSFCIHGLPSSLKFKPSRLLCHAINFGIPGANYVKSTSLALYTPSPTPVFPISLPHAWVDPSLVAFKAAKSDAAHIPTHLWSSRISLVLGCGYASDDVLNIPWHFLLVYGRRRLF